MQTRKTRKARSYAEFGVPVNKLRTMPALFLIPHFLANIATLHAQGPPQAINGSVRTSDSSVGLVGVELLIGDKKTTTNERGAFRFEGLAKGQYFLTARRIGYRPLRVLVSVAADAPTELTLRLEPAPVVLPTLVAEASRPGLYGFVTDSANQPLRDAKVAVLGFMGGDAPTDSTGAFAFPKANSGTYMIHVTKPGFGTRRIAVEVHKGRGREVSIRLVPASNEQQYPGEAEALWQLRRRLAFNFTNTRMTQTEMEKFGSMRVCDIPKINIRAGDPTTVILNGVRVLREVSLCNWRIEEIELLEFCDMGDVQIPMPLGRSCIRS